MYSGMEQAPEGITMKGIFRALFGDFRRIYRILSHALRVRTGWLFCWLALQSFLEVLFLICMTYMGTALTASEALRQEIIFQGIFALSPSLDAWASEPRRLVLLAGAVVVVVSILKSLVSWWTARSTSLLSEDISIGIGQEIMSRFLYRSYAWHLSSESASTFQRMMWRHNVAGMLSSLLSMYACMLTVAVLFLSLVGQEPMLTTLVVGIVGVIGVVLYKFMRFNVDRQARRAASSSQEETRALMCATHGIRDVLIYRQQEVFQKAITDAAQSGRMPRMFAGIAATIPTWVLEAAGFLMVVVSIAYLVYVEQAGIPRITAALALLMLTAWRVLPYCNRVVGYQVTIRGLRPMTHAVLELLEQLRRAPSDPPPAPARDFTFRESIRLEHVCFQYAGAEQPSLQDVSFTIHKGEKIGIIGSSGAGKSTLVGVLSGLLPATGGSITVDGKELTPARGAAFAAMIGYVPQSPFLFAGTLAENIAFSEWGRPWDEERVRNACRMAAIDFVDSHPQGLNQPIGENGAGLSGGQAQRVSIARAMYARPQLLIFDEATSALDQANENSIQQTIMELAEEVTCVIIAHRLTTVEKCDRLIWMENGRIVMQGGAADVLGKYT